jgi:hypothetical protein
MKMKIQPIRSVGHRKGHAKGKAYSYKCLHQENRDLSNKQCNNVP